MSNAKSSVKIFLFLNFINRIIIINKSPTITLCLYEFEYCLGVGGWRQLSVITITEFHNMHRDESHNIVHADVRYE